jgi:FMN-dependent NADH-azoreductase
MVPQLVQPERILRIDASPRQGASHSTPIVDAFLAEYGRYRTVEIDRVDAFEDLLPFGRLQAEAKMAAIAREPMPAAGGAAWEEVLALCERLRAADLLLFAVPMWNGSIPWALKLFIDIVTQPGYAFRFDPESGYEGLLGGRRAVPVYVSRVYALGVDPAFGVDHQSTYLRWWLRFCGIEEIRELRLQPTSPTADFDQRRADALAAAKELAREMATTNLEAH